MELKRVVVTGMGVISPIGNDLASYTQSLKDGKGGVGPLTLIDPEPHATKIAAEVKNFVPEDYIDRKDARRMGRFTQFAVVAADQAVADSGIDFKNVDTNFFGSIIASGIGGMPTFEKQYDNFLKGGPRRVSPFFVPMLISDISAGQVSIKYGLKGINYCTTSACASASHAIGEAFNSIRFGRAIGMVAGGSEASTCVMGVSGFNALKALSTRNDDPEHASRPFDLNRDGFVMGEGGGMLVLEELEMAKARGAKIYGEIVGAGFTGDAYHITAPVPGGDGAMRAMNLARQDAGWQPEDVDYLNAHGTSTSYNDSIETEAIKKSFGEHAYNMPISSTKSMVGHLLGASGAVEAVAVLSCMNEGFIHPTINYETPDPECDLNYVPNTSIKKQINKALSNSFGFGGHNVSLAFKRYEE
jgi:3-oxoacyl-[acyl-carrier-protein] synthase II